tara:strand:- start:709 stop:972 length:264 start_codon:yes stop_codon:yes gene_type:complete
MDYLESDYLEKAAIARRLKARILKSSASRQKRTAQVVARAIHPPGLHKATPRTATDPSSIARPVELHLLPATSPMDDGLDGSRADAA